jgi:hypothetical protein
MELVQEKKYRDDGVGASAIRQYWSHFHLFFYPLLLSFGLLTCPWLLSIKNLDYWTGMRGFFPRRTPRKVMFSANITSWLDVGLVSG